MKGAVQIGLLIVAVASLVGVATYSVSNDHVEEESKITMLHMGDMMFGRVVANRMAGGTNPLQYMPRFYEVVGVKPDIVMGNLEGPITTATSCQTKAYSFAFAPSVADLLSDHGITHVSLANNHSNDCYAKGVEDTKKYLNMSGIGYVGSSTAEGSVKISTVERVSVAFVGIDNVLNTIPMKKFYDVIRKTDGKVDTVIVHIHWGEEYATTESKKQNDIAHALIDAGADLIIGHHPHVVQPVEVYKDRAIFYSLGNFIFDQVGDSRNRGFAVFSESDDMGTRFEIVPYTIKANQPKPLDVEDKLKWCKVYLQDVVSDICSFNLPTSIAQQ